MKKTGIEVLSSGNLLKWEQETVGMRGAIQARFGSPPSKQDLDEAKSFVESMPPESAEIVSKKVTNDVNCAKNFIANHLYGGSRN